MVGQIIAGVCFFINHDREEDEQNAPKPHLDYVAYVCVAIVMVLNIFVSCFDSRWSRHITFILYRPQETKYYIDDIVIRLGISVPVYKCKYVRTYMYMLNQSIDVYVNDIFYNFVHDELPDFY